MSKEWPKTARQLLEARYQAFVDGNIDFILESHHPETKGQIDRDSIEAWSKESKWKGLKIEDEKIEDDKTFITFAVKYEKNFETTTHREYAEFRKHEGRWNYFDSQFPKSTVNKRETEKTGRNEPCPCGSGKKFKKCCERDAA